MKYIILKSEKLKQKASISLSDVIIDGDDEPELIKVYENGEVYGEIKFEDINEKSWALIGYTNYYEIADGEIEYEEETNEEEEE